MHVLVLGLLLGGLAILVRHGMGDAIALMRQLARRP
jgi:hypothetical protein